MELCDDNFNKFTLFYSNLNIVSNIFYLITGILLLIYKYYFFGIFFTVVSIISSIHHYYNNNLVTCHKIQGREVHSYLSNLDVGSVNILLVILLIYLFKIDRKRKILHLLSIIICGIIGIVLFFYSQFVYKGYIKKENKLEKYNKNILQKKQKKEIIIKYKREIVYGKILYETIHSIWHVITGLVGVIAALFIINK